MILHRQILSLILHDIRGQRLLHPTLISVKYSSSRSHFALVDFFIFLHDKVGRAVTGSATSIGGPLIGTVVSICKSGMTNMGICRPPISSQYIAYALEHTQIRFSIFNNSSTSYFIHTKFSWVSMARRYEMLRASSIALLIGCSFYPLLLAPLA